LKHDGALARTETRNVSSDKKEMTETVTLTQPDGKQLKNVIVYEKK
jgi:hypothetical protein